MTGNDILARFRGCPVLVVGDLMLDEFVWGHVSRISPEAPVPVVEVARRTFTAGGAANTAANIAALGGHAVLAGALGDDAEGTTVCDLLRALGVNTDPTLRQAGHPTTTKTRVIAHSQQVVRIDRETPGPVPDAVLASLLERIAAVLPTVRGVVVSDYGKGVVTRAFVGVVIEHARAAGIPVVVDPKGTDYAKYAGATVVKPNQLEAGQVLGRELRTDADVSRAGEDLMGVLGPDSSVLITRGAHGMTLFERERDSVHIPARAQEVYDVTGAGDTVAGTLGLGLAIGAPREAACRLAGLAAAVVVGKIGTATCTFDELKAAQQVARW